MANALSKIIAEAKRQRKAHPNKHKSSKKPWIAYVKDASAKFKRGGLKKRKPKVAGIGAAKKRKPAKRKPVKRRPVKRKAAAKPKRKRTTRRKKVGRKVTKYAVKTEKTMSGKRRRRSRRSAPRTVKYRRVSGSGSNTGMLLGVAAVGVGLLLLMNKSKTSTATNLPPVTYTGNPTRDGQASSIVNYALAAGLAWDLIAKIIDKVNTSSDSELKNIYDRVDTGATPISDIA